MYKQFMETNKSASIPKPNREEELHPINEIIAIIDNMLESHQKLQYEVAARLDIILLPDAPMIAPQEEVDKSAFNQSNSPLVYQLTDIIHKLSHMQDYLARLADRIQL